MRHLRIPAALMVVGLLLAACGGQGGGDMPTELGEGEGELNLVIWAGYAEDGSAFPDFDWVTPFEEETGCIVNAQTQADSATGVRMLQSGEFDGGSFSGNATDRLMAAGDVAPVNVELLENYDERLRGPQAPAAQLAGRSALRRAARPRAEPPDVEHRRGGAPRPRGTASGRTPPITRAS